MKDKVWSQMLQLSSLMKSFMQMILSKKNFAVKRNIIELWREAKLNLTILNLIFGQKLIRKREVLISRVSIYIVIIIVTCHSIREARVWKSAKTTNVNMDGTGSLSLDCDLPIIINHEKEFFSWWGITVWTWSASI